MSNAINLVQGAEWVIRASLKDSSGALIDPISDYTISAQIILSRSGSVLLPLTVGNGRVTVGATAEDIVFRIDEADTAAGAAVQIPLGDLTKLRVKLIDNNGVTSISSVPLRISRDGGTGDSNDVLALQFAQNSIEMVFDGSVRLQGAPGSLGATGFVQTLLDDPDASTFLTTLGFSAFIKTLIDDGSASAAQTTLGISTFVKTLLDDADASAFLTTLGVSTFIKTLLDDTDAATARATLGALALGGGTMTGAVTLSGDPASALHAATKQYVDAVAQGLDTKPSVQCATTANITLSGEQTIDGVTTSASRVLVKNQSTASQNGIYVSGSGAWTRATDADAWAELPGAFCFVEEGTVNADTGWVCTSNAGGTLGSTSVTWTQFSGAGTYSAGSGLNLSGTQFSIPNSGITNAMLAAATIFSKITFTPPATGATLAIADGETLSYEKGTWTPTFVGSGTAGTPTYALQNGVYEKIGRLVIVRFSLQISALGSASGDVRIGGLPYAANAGANSYGGFSFNSYSVTGLAANCAGLVGFIMPSTQYISVNQNGNAGTAALTTAQAGGSASLFGWGVYHV